MFDSFIWVFTIDHFDIAIYVRCYFIKEHYSSQKCIFIFKFLLNRWQKFAVHDYSLNILCSWILQNCMWFCQKKPKRNELWNTRLLILILMTFLDFWQRFPLRMLLFLHWKTTYQTWLILFIHFVIVFLTWFFTKFSLKFLWSKQQISKNQKTKYIFFLKLRIKSNFEKNYFLSFNKSLKNIVLTSYNFLIILDFFC